MSSANQFNQSEFPSWEVVEKAIAREIQWLKETIMESPHKEIEYCKDCIYRRLAILIVSGKIKAKDIKSTICLWGREKVLSMGKSHGKEWHAKMMEMAGGYFKSLNYDIALEPNLNMGRADLGIYKNGERDLFIEVGTISLPKLLFNLETMGGSDFLLILDPNHAVEFAIFKAGYKLSKI